MRTTTTTTTAKNSWDSLQITTKHRSHFNNTIFLKSNCRFTQSLNLWSETVKTWLDLANFLFSLFCVSWNKENHSHVSIEHEAEFFSKFKNNLRTCSGWFLSWLHTLYICQSFYFSCYPISIFLQFFNISSTYYI